MSAHHTRGQEDDSVVGPSDLTWIARREATVQRALEDGDLARLRELAALPGGFGSNEMRKKVWTVLLGTKKYFGASQEHATADHVDEQTGAQHNPSTDNAAWEVDDRTTDKTPGTPHRDEAQVRLDTARSFVTYPKGIPADAKQRMQADLQDLIVGVLGKHPALNYFQGYHDIMSVLYLTYIPRQERTAPQGQRSSEKREATTVGNSVASQGLDEKAAHGLSESTRDTEEWRTLRECAEVVSLCRVRDAMGQGMQSMMGLLRILKRILNAGDPELARFSAHISPIPTLPFFALSWILCLFSHDVDTLEPIQRMFDYLLSRNPISAIYLAVAILISKESQMFALAKKLSANGDVADDPSLLHPLFSRLPPMVPDIPVPPATDTVGMVADGEAKRYGVRSADAEFATTGSDDDVLYRETNPYTPIALSEIFILADDLMLRFPWDGPIIRGREIMGDGSVICTYEREQTPEWTLQEAETWIDREVVYDDAGDLSDDEDDVPDSKPPSKEIYRGRPILRWWSWTKLSVHMPRNRLGTVIAAGVMLVGIGIAISGLRGGGRSGLKGDWNSCWAMIVLKQINKSGVCSLDGFIAGWRRIGSLVEKSISDLL